jgi:hypothetical protein
MSGIGKQLRGSGLAKSGFKSKYDVVNHERKGYADGSDEVGVQNDEDKKSYDEIHSKAEKERSDISSRRQQQKDEKTQQIEKESNDIYKQRLNHYERQKTYFHKKDATVGPKINKFLTKYVEDPVTYVANKLLPENERATMWDKANRKARKDALGYKKGGKVKKIK